MSCTRADAFLEARHVTVRETVDARKQRYGSAELKELFSGATRLVAVRGKQQVEFDLSKGWPAAAELEAAVLGPTGNLRAPMARVGETVVVGFGEEPYGALFG